MGKQRKDPSRRPHDAPDPVEDDVGGGGDNEFGEMDDFDNFLRTIDDSSDSDEEDDAADPADDDDEDDNGDDDDDDDDDEDEDDEEMEPEEDEDLNEDEEEAEDGDDSEEQEENSSDDQGAEEGVPVVQNGIGNSEGSSSEESEGEETADGKPPKMTAKKHKMDLQKLQDTDPEFFAFLKENDKELLEFDDSDDEEDSDDEDAVHKPPETLEEASDSEAEEERLDDTSDEHKKKVDKCLKKGVVDINVITYWQTQLSQTREITVLTNVVEALQCAVTTLSQGETAGLKWRVDGSANFNALVRLCIKEIKGFCVRFLCGNDASQSEKRFDQKPFEVRDKSKQKWVRLRPKIKTYMEIMVKLFKCMGNPDAIASVLRHCLRMSGFWALMATKSYKMMRALITIWSQADDSCRVIAFLTIIRITNYSKDVFLLHMFKQMYIAYVANCKFTSVNTWPAINFMRSSLVELYLLDTSLAYSVAFPFIRQLAIHLRNALSPNASQQNEGKQKKSEASRVVYSWQFVHSLHLWADVLAQAGASNDENLKLLIYPVVQICMGTIKLIPTKKFIPIRFHIVRMLIKLQEKAGVFIPVLPLITEVLRLTDFSSKSASKFSVRPIDLSCCLKADASESGYLKAVSDNVFETTLLYCKAIGTDIGFPEIVSPTAMFLRSFLKKNCKNVEVNKKFKTLLEKIDANSKFVSDRRNKALESGTFTLADKKSHRILQVQMQTSKPQPPILAYATEYFKLNQKAQVKARRPALETREERLIPKPKKQGDENQKASSSKTITFDKPMFDSEDEEDEDEDFTTKLDITSASESQAKKSKKAQKKKRKITDEDNDEDDDGEEESEVGIKADKKKKKKANKGKKKKVSSISLDTSNDVQDELVDFELSD